MENKSAKTRRGFIKKLALYSAGTAGVLVLLSLFRQAVPRLSGQAKKFKVGKPADFPMNNFTFLPDCDAFIYRDYDGVRVVSAVCTHLGCIIEKTIEGFDCPCHGSIYNEKGEILSGPAPSDLSWFNVEISPDGKLVVDTGTKVPSETKLHVS